jgi:hypothetical protein
MFATIQSMKDMLDSLTSRYILEVLRHLSQSAYSASRCVDKMLQYKAFR